MRENILEKRQDAKLAVYAVWMPMLAGEERSDWDGGALLEPRVVHLWDEDTLVGSRLAEAGTGELDFAGGVVWDAYLLFGPDAVWGDEPPTPVAAGSTIIGETDELAREAATLLR